jgi:hypothetical protein
VAHRATKLEGVLVALHGSTAHETLAPLCEQREMSSLDHVTLVVGDYKRAKAFYEKALAPLGIKPVMDFGQACGFGRDNPTHVAFAARSRAAFVLDLDGHDIEAVFHGA